MARRFPVRIGRQSGVELCLEEPGVWDQHLSIEATASKGFLAKSQPQAMLRVNGEPVSETWLRNGDLLEFGSVKVQFWLAQAEQGRLRITESLPWLAIVLMTLAEIALIYWLVKRAGSSSG